MSRDTYQRFLETFATLSGRYWRSMRDRLSRRQLNRALLARQLLLERADLPAVAAVEHLVGLQAQAPLAPYVALWSRLSPFDPIAVGDALAAGRLVRTHAMRATVHLFSRRDALTLRGWIGAEADQPARVEDVVVRYLAAFGPASVPDIRVWSGLPALREVVDRLHPRLRVFHDQDGREVYDLPDAPRPDPDTPAPIRFLPEYDNVLLSHADRSRVIPDGRSVPLPPGEGARTGTVLVDGEFRATWELTSEQGT